MILGIFPGMCKLSSNQIIRRREISRDLNPKHFAAGEERFSIARTNKVSSFEDVADETPKQGSFKIDDGNVIGRNIYTLYINIYFSFSYTANCINFDPLDHI
jgi:hypothetical protein